MPTIALVDDDRNILTSVSIALEAENYTVQTFRDGESALAALRDDPPDLAIFDIKMPRMDGMELLRRLRETHATPVIFLTSKDDDIDEMLGLRMGADDYIRKPFSLRLLIERIRTVLRRAAPSNNKKATSSEQSANDSTDQTLVRGRLLLDPARYSCSWNDQEVSLTVTEFLVLRSLAERPGHVKTREQIMDAAYDEHIYVDDRTIDSHVKRMRKKFKRVDPDFAAIDTLYGVGYRFTEK